MSPVQQVVSAIGEIDIVLASEFGVKPLHCCIKGDGLLYDLFVCKHLRIRVNGWHFFFGKASGSYRIWLPIRW